MFIAMGKGMDRLHRRALPILPALLVLALPAQASELRASAVHVAGIVIHDSVETLRDYCVAESGRLYLALPDGSRWELVVSPADPAIVNPGDGSFHAFDAAEVRNAMAEVRFPLQQISAEVFILPYPRRASLESAAGPGLILLSPGVRALSREHQHSEIGRALLDKLAAEVSGVGQVERPPLLEGRRMSMLLAPK